MKGDCQLSFITKVEAKACYKAAAAKSKTSLAEWMRRTLSIAVLNQLTGTEIAKAVKGNRTV